MSIHGFFRNVRRFNSLIPLLGFVVLLCMLTYLFFVEGWGMTRTSVKPPETSATSESAGMRYDLHQSHLQDGDMLLMTLVARREKANYSERSVFEGVRNLLFIDERRGINRWLFEGQVQKITSHDLVTGADGKSLGVLVIAESLNLQSQDGRPQKNASSTIYLAARDLSQKEIVLQGVDEVMKTKQFGDEWSFLYKKDMTIRQALYSMPKKKIVHDVVIASLEKIN